jgi:hypothetical protein
MIQSRFYVFVAIGKLLFGSKAISEAMNFAVGMVGYVPQSMITAKKSEEEQIPLSFGQ